MKKLHMLRCFSPLLLSATLLVPAAMQAQDHDHDHDQNHDQRYYDSSHKDYHQWNDDEDHRYHDYLKEKHMKDHDWAHASKREQSNYWAWRHDHPDSH